MSWISVPFYGLVTPPLALLSCCSSSIGTLFSNSVFFTSNFNRSNSSSHHTQPLAFILNCQLIDLLLRESDFVPDQKRHDRRGGQVVLVCEVLDLVLEHLAGDFIDFLCGLVGLCGAVVRRPKRSEKSWTPGLGAGLPLRRFLLVCGQTMAHRHNLLLVCLRPLSHRLLLIHLDRQLSPLQSISLALALHRP